MFEVIRLVIMNFRCTLMAKGVSIFFFCVSENLRGFMYFANLHENQVERK